MSETETSQQSSVREQTGKPKNKHSVVIAITLLIVALAVALGYEVRTLQQQNQAIEAQLQSTMASLEKSEQEQRSALSAETRERDQVSARQESLEQEVQSIRDQLGRDRSEWIAAESDYLLRVANRRLVLDRDVHGALIALHSVDGLLADSANPLYLPVREQLRAEILSLEAITPVDVDGIALELSGLSKQLDALPLATGRHDIAKTKAQAAQTVEEEGSVVGRFFSAMWNGIKGMVTVRRLDQKILPLLPPEQRYFLAQNLRLRLEMARLALLRGDVAIYQENLKAATAWLDEYYDLRDAAVKHSRDAVARLAQINIAPALPEIGASLRTLERIREKKMGSKPAASRGRQP